jgi:hypothetical protein
MICQITNQVIKCQDLSPGDLGRWLLVTHGCMFLFDLEGQATAIREMFRSYSKYNRIVH